MARANRLSQDFTEVQDLINQIPGKAEKDTSAVEGNIAVFDSEGNPVDSGTGETGFITDAEREKLAGIESGAEVNVQPDWSQGDSSADDYIKNRTHWIEGVEVEDAQLAWTGDTAATADFFIKDTSLHFVEIPPKQGADKSWQLDARSGNYDSVIINYFSFLSALDVTLFKEGLGVQFIATVGNFSFSRHYDIDLNIDLSTRAVHKLDNEYLDMDITPTAASDKPVTSGGVRNAISALNGSNLEYTGNDGEYISGGDSINSSLLLLDEAVDETNGRIDNLKGSEVVYDGEDGDSVIVHGDTVDQCLKELDDQAAYVISNYQYKINDLDTIRAGAALGATAYQKPSTGIPKSALASAVKTSLEKADTALQPSALDGKQDTLISGENIKTINGQSVLGSGDIQTGGGSADAVKYTEQTLTDSQKEQARANIGAADESDVSQLRSEMEGIQYIKLGGGTLPSYYLVGSTLSLSNTGDYVEIDCAYTGTGSTYEDKNFLLTQDTYTTRNRLGFPDLSHFAIRVHGSGNTDLSWNISGTIIKERHTYKLVKVATGFELFIDGVSKGIKTYSGDGVFTFNNIGSRASSYGSGIFVGDVYSVAFYDGSLVEVDILDTTKMTNVVVETTLSLEDKINDVAEHLPKGGINFFSYDNTNKEFYAYVNIPATDKYIGIPVKLQSTRGTINDEIWFRHIWEIDDDNSGVYQYAAGAMTKISQKILVDGESEFVSQMVTGDPCDFTGGVHGDEAIDIDPSCYAKFFADGVELDITADIPLSRCNEVSYIQRSTLHRTARLYENYKTSVPTSSGTGVLSLTSSYTYAIDGVDTGLVANNINSVYTTIEAAISGDNLVVGQQDGFWTLSKVRIVDDAHTILAHHLKQTIFDNRGYTTKNALVFTEDGADYSFFSYHGICCASKIAASVGHNENYVDVAFTGSGQNYLQDTGMRLFQARNATNSLSVEIEAMIKDGGGLFTDGQCSMFVWDRSGDSKYYRRTPNYTPSNNSRFASEMVVKWGMSLESD